MPSTARSRRIDIRVTEMQDALIREAAALAGETVSGFLVGAAQQRAHELLDERRHLVMSARSFDAFAAALDAPPEQVPELVELFELPAISDAAGPAR